MEMIRALKGHLKVLGYEKPSGALLHNYDYTTEKGKNKVDLLAFGDPNKHDISTSCIAVKLWPNGGNKQKELSHIAYTGAPISLFVSDKHVEFWPVNTKTPSRNPDKVTHNNLNNYINKRANDLSPESLISAKRGKRQLSFFDIDPSLEQFARKATQDLLVEKFEESLRVVSSGIGRKKTEALTRLSIYILAGRIFQDKLQNRKDLQTRDLKDLLKNLESIFPGYFHGLWSDFETVGESNAERIYNNLVGNVSFRNLTNDMLAYFYENTLVSKELRDELGVYYTPRSITERILSRLPIEDLPPSKRIIFDGTCGSGNMLLSAYDRLSGLLPAGWPVHKQHKYFQNRILGIDGDPFACEIAKLSLSLYNLPKGDDWKIKQGDVFNINPVELFEAEPHIIIGNPPFHESRSKGGKRDQLAAGILDLYIDWLPEDGLLGIVLPLTFLHAESSKIAREKLVSSCDIFELWRFPEGAIPGSSVSVAIVLAQKRSTTIARKNLFTRIEVEHVDPDTRKESITPLASYVVPQDAWEKSPDFKLTSSQFDELWFRLDSELPPMEPGHCIIRNGIIPGKSARKSHFDNQPHGSNWRPTLYSNKSGDVLNPFMINWEAQEIKYIKYPSNDFIRERNENHFNVAEKVVFNAVRNPDYRWRIIAGLDKHKLVVNQNFHYLIPKGNLPAEVFVGLLNSTIVNAWLSSRSHHRWIPLTTLKKLPFPEFNEDQTEEISSLVNSIITAKESSFYVDKDVRDWIKKVDDIIFNAYHVTSNEKKNINNWMSNFQRPGKEWKHKQQPSLDEHAPEPRSDRVWEISGEVQSINASKKTVTIWIHGIKKSKEIPIPDRMPGWALRPKSSFLASLPWRQRNEKEIEEIEWLSFEPLDFGYLSEEELLERLGAQK